MSVQSIIFYLTLTETIPELEMTLVERQADIQVQARSVWTASGPSGVDKIYVSDCRYNYQLLQVPTSDKGVGNLCFRLKEYDSAGETI